MTSQTAANADAGPLRRAIERRESGTRRHYCNTFSYGAHAYAVAARADLTAYDDLTKLSTAP
jgi:hypothetical protein